MDRRQFLGAMVLGAGAVGLSACGVSVDNPGGTVKVDWHLPINRVDVFHPAPDVVFPRLREVTGVAKSSYDRMQFWFDRRVPSYNWMYDTMIVGPGTGEPIFLNGNMFLHLQFNEAYAHEDNGDTSIVNSPGRPLLGFHWLRDWVLAGDFEAAVDIGIGMSTEVPLQVRLVEGEARGLKWVAIDFRAPS